MEGTNIQYGCMGGYMVKIISDGILLNPVECKRLRLICHERYRDPKYQAHVNRTPSAFSNLTAEGIYITIKGILEGNYFIPEQITRAEKYSAQMYYQLIKDS
jgi:hypothetical protein